MGDVEDNDVNGSQEWSSIFHLLEGAYARLAAFELDMVVDVGVGAKGVVATNSHTRVTHACVVTP